MKVAIRIVIANLFIMFNANLYAQTVVAAKDSIESKKESKSLVST